MNHAAAVLASPVRANKCSFESVIYNDLQCAGKQHWANKLGVQASKDAPQPSEPEPDQAWIV